LKQNTLARILAPALFATACASVATPAPLAYTLGNGGSTLIGFDVQNPGGATTVALSGSLDAIDFRPLTGELFGYSNATQSYFLVDPLTGALTLATLAPASPTASSQLDVDFNPTIDRMRTVTANDENIVYNPLTGGTSPFTMLFYVTGDPNAGANPTVTANGYTNSFAGATTTTQYVLDTDLNLVAILGNNAGTLTTVAGVTLGGNPLDFTADAGLDIFFDGSANTGYALLNVGGSSGIYTIDLGTGQASLLGNLPGAVGTATGLAVQPIPEPGTFLLLGAGFVALCALRRRSRLN
jgi:hypothetical protein